MTTSAEAQVADIAHQTVESVASTAAPPVQAEPKKTKRPRLDTSVKYQKRVETLQAKIDKLSEENKRLKDQYRQLKSSYSRVHRIPKKQD